MGTPTRLIASVPLAVATTYEESPEKLAETGSELLGCESDAIVQLTTPDAFVVPVHD